jgi:hypothetical protein
MNQQEKSVMNEHRIAMMRRWVSMWERCCDHRRSDFQWYGARGIKVCQEWQDFEVFFAFFGLPPFDGATIDRIDNDGDYSPGNCRWASRETQNNNTRRSKMITWNGKTQSIRDWAKEYGIGSRRLSERLRRGWSIERALETPSPQSYETELADRRQRNAILWAENGKRYAQASRQRKIHSDEYMTNPAQTA